MNFADQLRATRMKSGPVLHQFLLEHKRNSKVVHAFFEGYEDESFYHNFVVAMIPPGYSLRAYRCGNKSEVYATFVKINPRITSGRAIFFVDKDFSDYLDETWPTASNIFVTRHYSIENYLVTAALLRRALRELFQMTDSERALALIVRRFDRVHRQFCRQMVPITAILIALRRQKAVVNLDNLQLNRVFDLTLTMVSRKKSLAPAHKALLEAELGITCPRGTMALAQRYRDVIRGHEPKAYVRGKYETWMFTTYLALLCAELKLKNSSNLHRNSVIQILGPRLTMPDDIRDFLTANLATLA